MRRSISASIDIGAPPAVVWAALADLPAYERWNPYIVSAVGTAERGERLTLRMKVGGRTFRVRPTVVDAEKGRGLSWVGRLGIPGILDARHEHHLEPIPAGTRYVQREEFAGLLVPFVGGTLTATQAAFRAMNEALAQRVVTGRHDERGALDETLPGGTGGTADHLG